MPKSIALGYDLCAHSGKSYWKILYAPFSIFCAQWKSERAREISIIIMKIYWESGSKTTISNKKSLMHYRLFFRFSSRKSTRIVLCLYILMFIMGKTQWSHLNFFYELEVAITIRCFLMVNPKPIIFNLCVCACVYL